MATLIGWVLFGLIAGAAARFLYPTYDRLSVSGTIFLGILGSLVGGALAYLLRLGLTPYQPGGWIMSVIGAVVLLSMGIFATQPRPAR